MPYVRLSAQDLSEAMPEDEITEEDRAMTQSFQYRKPRGRRGYGGRGGDPLYVAVRPEQLNSAAVIASQEWLNIGRDVGAARDTRMEAVSAKFAANLAALGAVHAYIRYDGGGDEGFAYFVHCVFKDGTVRDMSEVVSELRAAGALAFPYRGMLADDVAGDWAARLLGRGFGVGLGEMYGAFWVDLETGLVTDDPNATRSATPSGH